MMSSKNDRAVRTETALGAEVQLTARARQILRQNDLGEWTRAAPNLHTPHQWSWAARSSVNRSNVKHYRHTKPVTDYREYLGRSYYTVGQEGWEEVADYALDWAVENAKRPVA